MVNVVHKDCGTIHFPVTRSHALSEVRAFNKYVRTLSKEEHREIYGGRVSRLVNYRTCRGCGAVDPELQEVADGDTPRGITVSPIVYEEK